MKATKKTVFVKTEYWDCGNDSHRHKSEDVAQRCMDRTANRKPPIPREMYYERYIHASKQVVNGTTFKEAGESIGVSADRAKQIVRKVLRLSLYPMFGSSRPPCSYYDVFRVREHKDYWLNQIEKVANHWGV